MSDNEDRGPGRPTVMTPEVLSKLEQIFAIDGTDEEACFFAGISTTPFYEYQKAHPEFKERKELLKKKPVLGARQTVVKAITGVPAQFDAAGNLLRAEVPADANLAMKYLSLKMRDEFATRSEVTGKNGASLGNPYSNLTDEEIAAELEKRRLCSTEPKP